MDEFRIRIAAKRPGNEIHHRKRRFRISRRNVDNQPLALTAINPHQRIAYYFMMRSTLPFEPALPIEHIPRVEIQIFPSHRLDDEQILRVHVDSYFAC